MSLTRQSQLLGLSRGSLYYQARGESAESLQLMRLLDEQYTRNPFYGVRKMTAWLRGLGYPVNEKRIRRLLRLMGLEAIYQRPRLSDPAPGHRVYPYLLRGLAIERPNQVWSTDITYVRLLHGFVYLVAVIDWFSRFVLSWEVSVTLESELRHQCPGARFGRRPAGDFQLGSGLAVYLDRLYRPSHQRRHSD